MKAKHVIIAEHIQDYRTTKRRYDTGKADVTITSEGKTQVITPDGQIDYAEFKLRAIKAGLDYKTFKQAFYKYYGTRYSGQVL
jgi:hypothetical protein